MHERRLRGWARSLRGAIGSEISIDRTGAPGADLDHTYSGLNGRVIAWAGVAAFGFFLPTLSAVSTLLNGPHGSSTVDAGDLIFFNILMPVITATAAGVLLIRWRPTDRVRSTWRTQLATFPVYLGIIWVGLSLMLWLGEVTGLGVNRYSEVERVGSELELLHEISSGLAGPAEELALMALLATVGRRAGWRWSIVVAVAVAVRVSFHLYYGWPAVTLALWAALAVLLYRRTGALLAIVLAHSTWNLGSLLLPLGTLGAAQRIAAAIGAAVVIGFLIRSIARQRRSATARQDEGAHAAAS